MTTLLGILGVSDIRSALPAVSVLGGAPIIPTPMLTNEPQPPDNPSDTVVARLTIFGPGFEDGMDVGENITSFRTQYAPDDVITVVARNAADEVIPFPTGLRWIFDSQGNDACASMVQDSETQVHIVFDEDLPTWDANEDGILISVTAEDDAIGSAVFATIVLPGVYTSFSIAPSTRVLSEGGPFQTVTASALDQFNNPMPLPSVGTWVCDPPGGVQFHPGEGVNPTQISWQSPGVFDVYAFMDLGEPPVETESNHCVVTCQS